MKQVAILGSTGSIGTSCLDVIRRHGDQFQVCGLTANRSWRQLAEQAKEFAPSSVILADESLDFPQIQSELPPASRLKLGHAAICQLAASPEVEIVVSGIVGAAGLNSSWAAVKAGKRLAIANKETLVVAGPLITAMAKQTGAELLPVDSEHNAIFQAIHCGRRAEVSRVILTASGGPFRQFPIGKMAEITPEMALDHPTWDMGPKITVDSATMMNKTLEVIEAKWLFDLEPDQIEVVVHPQSIIHSLVEFVDGSVIAQLSPPDMRLPIQYALTYPDKMPGISPKLDLTQQIQLELHPPNDEQFPALKLGFEAIRRGGTCGAVLNAANEVAVERFLAGNLQFVEIPRVCREVMDGHPFDPEPDLDGVMKADAWAREETYRWSC